MLWIYCHHSYLGTNKSAFWFLNKIFFNLRNEEIKTKGQDGEEIRIKSRDEETRTRKKRRRSELTEIKTKLSMTEESSRLTSSSSEFSRQTTSSSSNLSEVRAEESSLYVDVLIPKFNSEKSLPLAASLLERPGSGVIRCRSTQALQGPTGIYSGVLDTEKL